MRLLTVSEQYSPLETFRARNEASVSTMASREGPLAHQPPDIAVLAEAGRGRVHAVRAVHNL